jgi:hypothetical protein
MKKLVLVAAAFLSFASVTMASEKECFLDITYKNGKPKHIEIDVVKENRSEVLLKKISGSLSIEILLHSTAGETKTYINVVDTKEGFNVTTPSDSLALSNAVYKARVSCADQLL